MVISVNPFKSLPSLYNEESMFKYATGDSKDLDPHLYSIAKKAFQDLTENQK